MSADRPIILSGDPPVTPELVRAHGLSRDEYEQIERILGRSPTFTELGVFSVMWSEHCSYKSSKFYLRQLPQEGPTVVQGPGENAGAVDVGDGWLAVFKIESHNHPSYVEPYQGAATGVGGIIRDILAMGARPIALLNALKFGAFDYPRMGYLIRGVVGGISGYGNCVGVPTVGGEVTFSEEYNKNILVNVLCLGLVPKNQLVSARAKRAGSLVIYVGAATGRDGIHGASLLASAQFDSSAKKDKRPSVQVGDPFTEKLLIEACLEAFRTGAVEACQDMGAAGLTSSSSELAARGGFGVELYLDEVPLREPGLSPYEILLSESQERMLLIVPEDREEQVLSIFQKWELPARSVGRITDDGLWRVFFRGELVASIPVNALTKDAPSYRRPIAEPSRKVPYRSRAACGEQSRTAAPAATLRELLGNPNIASKRWVYRQYDHIVQSNTVQGPGADAAIVRIKGTRRGLALTVDSNFRLCARDPYLGGMAVVCEAALNVACVGARPMAITDCLNFGSPERPEIMWQFVRTIEGIRDAACALGIPVVSGNVSFYNETDGQAIPPTPTVGVVGILDNLSARLASHFSYPGDVILLIKGGELRLGATEYAALLKQKGVEDTELMPVASIDMHRVKAMIDGLLEAAASQLIRSAHDVSEGGIAVAIAESCFNPKRLLGAEVEFRGTDGLDATAALFAEGVPLVILSVPQTKLDDVREIFLLRGLQVEELGIVSASPRLRIGNLIDEDCEELYRIYEDELARRLAAHV